VKAKPAAASEKIRSFPTQTRWSEWLKTNHVRSTGIWVRLRKKGSGFRSVSYQEALEVALCYGWIDGQKRGESDETWLQRFLPRSPRSIWSKINREKVLALIRCGRMKPAGRRAIENAKQSGRWDSAYDSPKSAAVPADFQAALDRSAKARNFFLQLDHTNRYAVLFRIQTVKKAETRERKIREFIRMLEAGGRIHEPRPAGRRSRSQ
jgi:uncharacterized protein YdeI (YjbR/CyaY-like superfamily)